MSDSREVAAVRPSEAEESESDDEAVVGTEGERIRAEKDEERVKKMADPRKPSDMEVEHHCLTHLPYRNWCPVCIAAKGKDLDHRKDINQARGLAGVLFRLLLSWQ